MCADGPGAGVEPAETSSWSIGAGKRAARIASGGVGATVTVLDISIDKLQQLDAGYVSHTRVGLARGAVKRATT